MIYLPTAGFHTRNPSVSAEATAPDNGKTAGKGHKGQKASAGHGMRPGFEGGQMPLQRRVPKRGFNNIFAKTIVTVNVGALEKFENGAVVDTQALMDAGIVKKTLRRREDPRQRQADKEA